MSKTSDKTRPYVTGYVASTLLTLAAYVLVINKVFSSKWALFYTIITLAIIQLLVQVIFFLHLGRESKPRWQLMTFLFSAMVVLIVVLGSLWIMVNLNYHHDHSLDVRQTDGYIIQDEGIKP